MADTNPSGKGTVTIHMKHETDPGTLYSQLRLAEQRVYSNEEVAALPSVAPSHTYYNEWKIRKKSSQKLVNYLKSKNTGIRLLEIGSGNGWLSATLGAIKAIHVIGIDSNVDETMQAKKVFQHLDNVKFINGDIRSVSANLGKFDIIVFAASLQYFQSLASIIPFALSILHPGGEIHIVDSPIYNKMDLPLAIERSKRYYDQVGFPEMTKQYFHHSYEELRRYNHTLLFDPVSWKNRLLGKHGFPWVCIKNQK